MDSKKTRIVILAAGKGTRMKNELPKALTPLCTKPMIKYLLESIAKSGIDDKPIIVVGHKKEEIMKELGSGYEYVLQEEQLGTGHALMSAEKVAGNGADYVIVLPSDHPFISPETIKKLAEKEWGSEGKMSMATVKLPDFEDWREFFYTNFSRLIRDKDGNIIKSVEFRDASEEEKKITEVNPIYFCFEAKWLWPKLKNLKNDNAQKQYYLTDLIELAILEKTKIETVSIDPREALAANSREELDLLTKFAL